jgi:hypothetical protein
MAPAGASRLRSGRALGDRRSTPSAPDLPASDLGSPRDFIFTMSSGIVVTPGDPGEGDRTRQGLLSVLDKGILLVDDESNALDAIGSLPE